MQYTRPTLALSNPNSYRNQSHDEDEQFKQFDIELGDLAVAFAAIPDPRRAQGRVYWLSSLLCMAVGAILCNCLSVLAIAEWGAGLSPTIRQALGLPIDRSPNQPQSIHPSSPVSAT